MHPTRIFQSVLVAVAVGGTAGDVEAQVRSGLDSAEPILRIGAVLGDQHSELYQVTAARFVGDSGVLVACAGTSDIRLFDRNGRWTRSYGRVGHGPGEHVQLKDVLLRGDTIVSVDSELFRINQWRLSGDFIGTVSGIGTVEGRGAIEGLFLDGSWLVSVAGQIPPFRPGLHDKKAELIRLSPSEGDPTFMHEVFWEAVFQRTSSAGGTALRSNTYSVPYSARSSVVVLGESVFYSDARRTSLLQFLPNSGDFTSREIPLPLIAIPVSQPDRLAYFDEALGGLPDSRVRRFREILEEVGFPEFLPTITNLVSSTSGSVWAGRFVRVGDPHREWFVISDAGELLDHVWLPVEFDLLDASPDEVLGVETNELGVEFLVVYPRSRHDRL